MLVSRVNHSQIADGSAHLFHNLDATRIKIFDRLTIENGDEDGGRMWKGENQFLLPLFSLFFSHILVWMEE